MGFARLSSEHYMRWYSGADDGLDDDSLLFVLELMRHDKREMAVFFDREEPFEITEWLSWAKGNDKIFTVSFRNDGTPIVAVWFNGGTDTGRQVFSHFCGFSTAEYDELVRCGDALFDNIRQHTRIRQFIGVMPASYRHAHSVAYAVGYKKICTLEKALIVHGKERDAILTINDGGR